MSRPALFDLDGTLVDLAAPRDDLEALRAGLRALAEREGVPLDHFGIFPMYRALSVAGRGVAEARELIDSYEVRWARATARALTSDDALGRLLASGAPVALVTSNGRACVRALREAGLLPGAFPVEITRDECGLLKPDPEPVRRAVTALGDVADGDELPFVGDSKADREAVAAYARVWGRPPVRFVPVREGTGAVEPARSIDAVLADLAGTS
ncbi:phosphoglycolate phosphatase [Streptoalloteichus tenebrarius]|uniref:Phosphoglycolate phosphatase n=1 Tax=Streptoalloteichus tenebrarius (strain ATCC 17920 / DSM 40477 / JCM 4838 / CBS 697.72 / NBRC 16177 / NCIMB 11028 / NRRL B-12390 / A12253. 1 / ISP 5477) TaxID=1933 RepID=A0ABT1HRH8_STRSD|nr:HAD family hydrolase [Streptoalloteichus tenebrarius]MCP2258122.1 phosphoglycolate phosphatase [Streptoalloteichus tenebrarius]BFF01797.1 phosphoglycolate phosphatase [Streptoalloteichus tenebrarius]